MILHRRRVAAVGSALAIAVAVGCGVSAGISTAGSRSAVSPCGTVTVPTWSPDGTQVAWYGYRWPRPPLHHRVPSLTLLRAICVSDADGKNVHPLPYTICSEQHCSSKLTGPAGQLYWVQPSHLLFGSDSGIFTVPVGQKAALVTRNSLPFSADTGGDRVAVGASFEGCLHCSGPVRIFSVSSGAVVGRVGGTKLDNLEPSLSPDGTQVVFVRNTGDGSGRTKGIWAAVADGSHLRRLAPSGNYPLWSSAGNRIAYLAGASPPALWLVAPRAGASPTLLRKGVGSIFSWSPDGRHIAFSDSQGQLAVVDTTTKKVRDLLQLQVPYEPTTVAWSPDSRQLLVLWKAPAHSGCPNGLWRVPIDGAKPRLVHGC